MGNESSESGGGKAKRVGERKPSNDTKKTYFYVVHLYQCESKNTHQLCTCGIGGSDGRMQVTVSWDVTSCRSAFLNRRAAAWYRAARGSPGICHFIILSNFHE